MFDEDFGPLFVKFNSYFPYNAKLCLNGHEYLKRQLAKRGIGFEALDNGILRCDVHRRALGPALSALLDKAMPTLGKIVERFDQQIYRLWLGQQMQA